MKKQLVPFQNKSLAVYTVGSSGNPAIVFVHGNSMSSKIWRKQLDSSLSDKYHLIAFDLPGHGESDNLDSYTFSLLADSIIEVTNYFKLQKYIVVGNSLGGDLILQTSSKLITCNGVMLINTPPVSKPPAMEKALQPNPLIGMLFTKEYNIEQIDSFSKMLFHDLNAIPDFIASDFEQTDGIIRQTLAETVAILNYTDEVELLKDLAISVAIVLGENEKMANNEYYKSLSVPQLWNNKIDLIGNAAHCPQWENAQDFNKMLMAFCEKCLY